MPLKKSLITALFLALGAGAIAQNTADSIMIRKIYNQVLSNGQCYQELEQLCKQIGGRVSGSAQAEKAVKWGEQELLKTGAGRVFLQEVMVPHWVRGAKETGSIIPSPKGEKPIPINICALGGSIATPMGDITGEVIEVKSFEELKALGSAKVKGKLVFFNRPMDPTKIRTFEAYSGAVDQRGRGAVEAAKLGAVGVLVRSMTLALDDNPHTGAMHYADSVKKIPAAAISTKGAELLSKMLKSQPDLKITYKLNCKTLPDVLSHNVVAEIKGSEKPEEIIAVGGHLDSWDTGEGAHDDGAGIVQSMEVLRIFTAIGYKPKRTIRCVFWMNEENGLKGAIKYYELAKLNKEKHIAAIETDAGGFTPQGFSVGAKPEQLQKLISWKPLLAPYGIYVIALGGGGADTSPMEKDGIPCFELMPDSQRYFDFHHTPIDTFENVNKRELELGAGTLAAMIYLISEYGL